MVHNKRYAPSEVSALHKFVSVLNNRNFTDPNSHLFEVHPNLLKGLGTEGHKHAILNHFEFEASYHNWMSYSFKRQLELTSEFDIQLSSHGTGMMLTPFLPDCGVHINLGEVKLGSRYAYDMFGESYIQA